MANTLNPRIFKTPFANTSPLVDTIPDANSTTPGMPSYADGWGNETMIPIAAGGTPPRGQSFNGILKDITANTIYSQKGKNYYFDSDVVSVGGYPKFAKLEMNNANDPHIIVSSVAGNVVDFNAVASAMGPGKDWLVSGMGYTDYSQNFTYRVLDIVNAANGVIYICIAANGPGTAAGVREPSTTPNYWQTFSYWLGVRPTPVAAQIFYVRTDGNDANDGRTNNAAGACRTLQGMVTKIILTQSISPYYITISMGTTGDYGSLTITPSSMSASTVNLRGIAGQAKNCLITQTVQPAANYYIPLMINSGRCSLANITVHLTINNPIVPTYGAIPLSCKMGSIVDIFDEINIMSVGTYPCTVFVDMEGGYIGMQRQEVHFNLYGSTSNEVFLLYNKATISSVYDAICELNVQNVTGMGGHFINCGWGSMAQTYGTGFYINGTINSGSKFNVGSFSQIQTGGGGPNFFPGLNAGNIGLYGIYT